MQYHRTSWGAGTIRTTVRAAAPSMKGHRTFSIPTKPKKSELDSSSQAA